MMTQLTSRFIAIIMVPPTQTGGVNNITCVWTHALNCIDPRHVAILRISGLIWSRAGVSLWLWSLLITCRLSLSYLYNHTQQHVGVLLPLSGQPWSFEEMSFHISYNQWNVPSSNIIFIMMKEVALGKKKRTDHVQMFSSHCLLSTNEVEGTPPVRPDWWPNEVHPSPDATWHSHVALNTLSLYTLMSY